MKYVSKAKFTKAYCKLNATQRAQLKAHYADAFKQAIFAETMMEIERRWQWMREIDDSTPANYSL